MSNYSATVEAKPTLQPPQTSDVPITFSIREQIWLATPKWPWLQEIITLITACPHTGQTPLLLFSSSAYLIIYLVSFLLGVMIAAYGVNVTQLTLILAGWLLTTLSVSGLQRVIVHNASHGNVLKSKAANLRLAQVICSLIIMGDANVYFKNHRNHHLSKHHQTALDNTTVTLFKVLGFKPGMPVKHYWLTLFKLFSPLFVLSYIVRSPLKQTFLEGKKAVKVLTWLFWGLVAIALTLTQQWISFIIAYCIPVLVFYVPIHFLRFCVEHKVVDAESMQIRNKKYVADTTDAVFLGELPPKANLEGITKFLAWLGWWLRLFLWHGLLFRLLVLPGDAPVHDYHTRFAGSSKEDWANAVWCRYWDLNKGCPKWPSLYTENWGFVNSMNVVFQSFSQLPQNYTF